MSAHNGWSMDAATALRERFRALLKQRSISQSELCLRLTKRTHHVWREAHLSRILNGHIGLQLDDFAAMVDAAGFSMVELVREPGREFVADLTPSEMRILNAIRENLELRDAFLRMVDFVEKTVPPKRKPHKPALTRKQFYAPED
jgi:transcriptional regulator with XRE-family HTH domain